MLRIWRTVEGISLRQLGSEVGVSAATINRIEQGEVCDSQTLLKLINYFFTTKN